MKYSPLFWPVKLKGKFIYILDETLLPHKLKYIKVGNYKQAVSAIKQMKTRAIGQVLLVMYSFLLEYRRNQNKKNIAQILSNVADAFNSVRPTLSFKFLTDLAIGLHKQGVRLDNGILNFLEGLKAKRIEQAKECSGLIDDKDTILTHCNVSGLMPLIARLCRQQNKSVSFFVTETRPYLQGSRLTAWELKKAGCNVTVIADNMVAEVMKEGKISKVIVGADNLAQNGDIANKIGTYQIAIMADYFKIPFYVLCSPVSLAKTGEDIQLEIRPEGELLEFCGISIAPKGVKGYYPAFDITPSNLITKHIYLNIGDVVHLLNQSKN
ncbi:MAG: S-methyl-5-thioribose-1-phosphate isomerase [Candidatus Omnitrophica bacterium]|nr:S-methyl-5-thioribose-1-phosphate isomerase [Candidatus Omnitrophota bacterium]